MIPRTAAEKCYRLILIVDQSLYFINMLNMVFGFKAIRRGTRFRVALISQLTIAMNSMVAAPLQFVADRSFAGAGNAINQVIPYAHGDWSQSHGS
ncbi:hypothetical protein SAMN02799630_03412 [Paenibacillus sp. UNCCL117]|uniref:hypothetical protein n=1 Tax=unclassified Paenibacillus TaxID=185978 RepID=UPI000889F8C1|nr:MULTISPECIES: hypothetical protein [unclassified Paenibacillus]SDD44803.1 hypothetical protein SAMN04488602_108207 [Paenibacillus sp. cl123]SFW47045.1 hypothetical protein SAMN02799630_03412 [Paenibacillus sp. UNCCL117]